jgi:glycosyltransferase involved in cell wall biosynthesis
MKTFADLLLLALALPAALSCSYLLLLTLLSAELPPPPRSARRLRFEVIVPAHDEAAVIAHTVGCLRRLDWPPDFLRLTVVADNCSDATALIAQSAGARVLVRNDPGRRGKGYALAHAFENSAEQGWADALVVIDADAEPTPNLIEACAGRIERGAVAVQVYYGILNPRDSWRTRLLTIAQAAFHRLRSRARERLGLSCGIRGNGWCVTPALLRAVPYTAYSRAEDLEYGITLGLAGHRVHYADEAQCNAAMVSDERSARSQRRRWEGGRFEQIRGRTRALLAAALLRRDPVCLDLALDLLVLPLSYVSLHLLLLLLLAGLAAALEPALQTWVWTTLACSLGLLLYVLRGWQLSGIGWRGAADLAHAPAYLVWKLRLLRRQPNSQEWVRTRRELP